MYVGSACTRHPYTPGDTQVTLELERSNADTK